MACDICRTFCRSSEDMGYTAAGFPVRRWPGISTGTLAGGGSAAPSAPPPAAKSPGRVWKMPLPLWVYLWSWNYTIAGDSMTFSSAQWIFIGLVLCCWHTHVAFVFSSSFTWFWFLSVRYSDSDTFEMRSLRWLVSNWIYWVLLRGYLYLVLSSRLILCFSGGGCSLFGHRSLFCSPVGVFLFWYFCWHRLIRSSQKKVLIFWCGREAGPPCACCQACFLCGCVVVVRLLAAPLL